MCLTLVCYSGRDSTFPVDGAILPGGGTLVKTIECAVGQYVELATDRLPCIGDDVT